jgi:UDP-N-acetylglucosamine 4,6-dehydratase
VRDFGAEPRDLNGKSILVTGGTGSFGQRFVGRVLDRYEPRRLVVFSRDELKQYEMAQKFSEADHPAIRYFIGDVRDLGRLELAMRDIDYVVHAAALKQVPAAEYNPLECIKTNVGGAENVVTAAIRAGVRRVIALSTDKAANPINLYGASKLASDKIFVAANNVSGADGPRFGVVRYGNVVNSRGSVVPLYRRLIDAGETTLPITDERMTRFWITLDQGVDFVLASLERMIGGEIFVPKIPSMRLTDLADAMLPGAQLKTIGIRPGEKLHEVMVPREDGRLTLEFPDYYVIEPAFQFWSRTEYQEKYGGTEVDHEFQFSSDTNEEWLSADALREMIGG